MTIKQDTKTIISHSFIQLLKKKSLEDLTVKEIMENCAGARSTFYKHFKDKYDLMSQVYLNNVSSYYQNFSKDGSISNITENICNYIYDNKGYFIKIAKYKGQNSFSELLVSIGKENMSNMLRNKLNTEKLSSKLELSIEIFAITGKNIVIEWIDNDLQESPDIILEKIISNMPCYLVSILS